MHNCLISPTTLADAMLSATPAYELGDGRTQSYLNQAKHPRGFRAADLCSSVGRYVRVFIPSYMSVTHNGVSSFPWLLRAGMFVCGVIPWFVGSYFAFHLSRTANRALKSLGAVELVLCVAFGAALLFAFTVGG